MSNFPNAFDSEQNLYTVRDSLVVTLQQDYHPGDSSISVNGNIDLFPPTGIITLVDQVSNPTDRAISLSYTKKSQDAFLGLQRTPDSKDVFKPKKLTSVTMQLRAEHHNSIVKSIIAIENIVGPRKSTDASTIMGRVNHLVEVIHQPKAWFEADKVLGLAPFTVNFTSLSQGVDGPVGSILYEWDFGDGTTISTEDREISHVYTNPGIYTVSLSVTNYFGTDKAELHDLIKVRIDAPEEAVINFDPQMGQILTPGDYTKPPVLRTPVGQLVNLFIMPGENPDKDNVSYAGELLNPVNKKPLDAITNYTWALSDDLPHTNSPNTQAAYFIGGLHDLTLRVDTQFGAYRITNYENCIDSVETKNMWLWTTQNKKTTAFEFGINNETFKARQTTPLALYKDSSFLDDVPNSKKQKQEFNRNNGLAQRTEIPSGQQGTCLLFWAGGRSKNTPATMEEIKFSEYNAFTDTYSITMQPIERPWNWASLISPDHIYFILGASLRNPPAMSPTNTSKTEISLGDRLVNESGFGGYTFSNGAQEIQFNSTVFDQKGATTQGHFSSYRTTWRNSVGYILRSVWQDDHFSLMNFYKTEGTISAPFVTLAKILDVPNRGLKEGQLVSLSSGVYLFSNIGAALCYKSETGAWEITGGGNPGMFRMLQDNRVIDYDNEENTLVAASDGDRKAFLSFDYSNKAFIKFNEADLTYSTVGARPTGEQWLMGIY